MFKSKQNKNHTALVVSTLTWGIFITCGMNANAAENYKLRQALGGLTSSISFIKLMTLIRNC